MNASTIAQLAEAADESPDQLRRLHDACLILGIVESKKLDAAVIALSARIDQLGREAIDELTAAIARHKGEPPTDPPDDHRLPDDSTLPEVAVEYQPCPSCGHAQADKTYKNAKDSRKPVPGSPDTRFTYATCNGCGLRVRVVFYSGI